MQNKNFRREFSAGAVIYKIDNRAVKVALIARRQNMAGNARVGKRVWCLPKGKIEKGEASQEAAIREVQEETGLVGRPVKRLGDITYWFVSPVDKARVFKSVQFFLFEYVSGSFQGCDDEAEQARWFKINDALKTMAYPSEKKIMKIAAKEVVM